MAYANHLAPSALLERLIVKKTQVAKDHWVQIVAVNGKSLAEGVPAPENGEDLLGVIEFTEKEAALEYAQQLFEQETKDQETQDDMVKVINE